MALYYVTQNQIHMSDTGMDPKCRILNLKDSGVLNMNPILDRGTGTRHVSLTQI